jgi:RNA-directed DNA polymerase
MPSSARAPAYSSKRHIASILGMSWSDATRFADRVGRYYHPFDRRRTSGQGKWRHIDNPSEPLKALQRRIKTRILDEYPLPDQMHGGVSGRSTKGHAENHMRAQTVLTIDLRACFPSLNYKRIYSVYCDQLRCTPDVSRLLTKLSTFQGAVPQGAPTSSSLANLSLVELHSQLSEVASAHGLLVSFFVDDIAFSGAEAEVRKIIEPAIRTISRHGLSISSRKLHVLPSGVRQEVTGIVVNAGLSVARQRRDDLFHEITDLANAVAPTDAELKSIRGKIQSVRWVNPAQGMSLLRLANRLLPASGASGPRRKTGETRPCKGRSRCAG